MPERNLIIKLLNILNRNGLVTAPQRRDIISGLGGGGGGGFFSCLEGSFLLSFFSSCLLPFPGVNFFLASRSRVKVPAFQAWKIAFCLLPF